jgi:biliverdin reductase
MDAPVQIGLIGTGYAAKLRAEAIGTDARSQLVRVASHRYEQAQEFAKPYGATASQSWQSLIHDPAVDLVIISTVNREHGEMARAALHADKHVVVEYPLALDLAIAQEVVQLAEQKQKLLHVEHIELLGGLHQALVEHLPKVGQPFFVHYRTISSKQPAPQKWTYQRHLFGFPLMGALSRIHRLTNAFGPVQSVTSQVRYHGAAEAKHDHDESADRFQACICTAQLQFTSGVLAEISYGKGETFWQSARYLEVQGDQGALVFDKDQGKFLQESGEVAIAVGGRRGLFAQDTQQVLNALTQGDTLYVTPQDSLYALTVADAARRAAETQTVVSLT